MLRMLGNNAHWGSEVTLLQSVPISTGLWAGLQLIRQARWGASLFRPKVFISFFTRFEEPFAAKWMIQNQGRKKILQRMQNKRNGLKMISLVCGSFIDTVHCDRLVNSTKPLALADSKTQRMTRDKISRPVHPNLPQNVCCPCHILAKFRAVKTPFAMHTFDRSKVHLTWRKCCASKSAVASNSALSEFWMPPNTRPCCTSDFYEISKLFYCDLERRGERPR